MLVPALEVFSTPEKLNDILGSSSLEKSGIGGNGNSISDTPLKVKAVPIPKAALVKPPAAARDLPRPPAKVQPPNANAPPINAAPNNIFLKAPPPAPLITGTILTPSLPIGPCKSS